MMNFISRLREGARARALRTELQETEQCLQSVREALAHTEASLQKQEALAAAWTSERQALVDEKTTLAQQLCQVQAELEKMHIQSQDEIARLSREKNAITEVRSKELQQLNLVQQELEALYLDSREEIAKLEQERNQYAAEKANSERDLVETVRQLAATRAQLTKDQQALAAMTRARDEAKAQQEKSAAKLAEVTHALSTAQTKAEALAKTNQQLTDELQEQRKALVNSEHRAKTHARTLTEQNLLMQRQLHEIQAELEQYYLANREMQAVMANSAQVMHRARGMLTKTMLND